MNLHNISINAKYEVKLLKRSWLFRTFATLSIVVITFLLIIQYSPIVSNEWLSVWNNIALSSFMPFATTAYYNIAQAIILIFLAGTFLKKGQKLDTTEVIMVRPMSNSDYILGKTWGISKVFLGLNLIVLLICAFINVFVNASPFNIWMYIFYFVTISIPTMLFMLGLSFVAINIIKNQAVTFVILLGVIGVDYFYLSEKWYGILNVFGTDIPSVFSDLLGMSDISMFLLQRLCYVLAGVGLIFLTISFVNRLPERRSSKYTQLTMGTIMLLLSCAIGFQYVISHNSNKDKWVEYNNTFKQFANSSYLSTTTNSIEIKTSNNRIEATSVMNVKNNGTSNIDQIILYLNPSLNISSINDETRVLNFDRINQVVLINRAINVGDSTVLKVVYNGTIDQNVCYTDVKREFIDSTKTDHMHRFGKQYAYTEDKFTLLTPEVMWYPTTIPTSNPLAKYHISRDFTKYNLKVANQKNKTILSQGESTSDSTYTYFTNNIGLTGISLAIANYEHKSIEADSVLYEIYYFKGNDFFSEYFTHLSDTLPGLISSAMADEESTYGIRYPFPKFVLAETPIHFASYNRSWKGSTEYVQPEIIFIPEKASTMDIDFMQFKKRANNNYGREAGRSDEEKECDIFSMAIDNFTRTSNYGSGVNQFCISALFAAHARYIYSYNYPVLDITLNTLQTVTTASNSYRFWEGVVNDKQRANLYLESNSFQTATRDTLLDPNIFYEMLGLKATQLKMYILSYISNAEYEVFIDKYFTQHEFYRSNDKDFIEAFNDKFGIDLTEFLNSWYTQVISPELLVTDVMASKVELDDATKYMVEFKIYNKSNSDAILSAAIGEGGGRQGGGRMFFMSAASEDNLYYYRVPAGTAWHGKILTESQPSDLDLNFSIAKNLPTNNKTSFSKIDATTDDTIQGFFSFPVENFSMTSKGETIIDNDSPNFHIVSSNQKTMLKEWLKKEDHDKYHNLEFWRAPSIWTLTAADYFYGDVVKSAYYKSKGSGANSAVWEFYAENAGYYNIYVWIGTNGMGGGFGRGRGGRGRNPELQYYTISNEEWSESVSLDWAGAENGWYSLGAFDLPKGLTTITLSDKTDKSYVIADAIKFTIDERRSENSNRQIYDNNE